MKKMPFRFARRVRNLEIKSSYYCPTKKKQSYFGDSHGARRDSYSSSSTSSSSLSSSHHHHHHQQICPSCVLPIVVAFIFGFTVIQLIVIHRTIVAYKTRSLAFAEVYGPSHNDTKSQGDLLAFSKKFDSALLPIGTAFNASGTDGHGANGGGVGGPGANGRVVLEWKPTGQAYPYRIPRHSAANTNINHIWSKVKCPEVPASKLVGNISINVKSDVSLDSLTRSNPQVRAGGKWSPEDCSARFHIALIIPYRYRWSHLKLLLSVLHPMLRRQQMSYQIFVAEQFGNYTFNKGILMNAAFLLAVNSSTAFDCVIFHDVDLLPEMDTNIYGCAHSPSHLSVSIDAYGYRLPYSKLVGGVFAISVDHFIQVNGYSGYFWGWGGEDDDMYKRLIANQLPINRPRPDIAKYKMLLHGRRTPNQFVNPLIRTSRLRFPQDGLTTCHFRLVSSSTQPLFTHFLIDVGQPSWSVLEPHVHLESMIPPSPSSSAIHNNHRTSTSINSKLGSHSHSHQQHNHHHHQPSLSSKQSKMDISSGEQAKVNKASSSTNPKKNELFMLTGIARDNSASSPDTHHHHHSSSGKNNKNPGALKLAGSRQTRSLNIGILHHQQQQRLPATFVDSAQRSRKGWKSADQKVLLQLNKDAHKQQSLIISDSIVPFGDGGGDDQSTNHLNEEELALDPDVPVVQDDDDDEEGDDGDSDGEVV